MNWRTVLIRMAQSFFKIVRKVSEVDNFKYAIIDDTTIEKTGKTIEGITVVFDHTTHSYCRGSENPQWSYAYNFTGEGQKDEI